MIARGLREIENEIAADKFVWDQSLEDVHMNIGEDVREVFDVRKALQRRSATGSPSPENIERQIARWRQLLQTE